jgi:glycosyltransferase involved in cell wall biosynthesis
VVQAVSVNLAILGTRGVPASYGGFETLAEELGRRLVERGHRVTVYGRPGFVDRALHEHRGMRVKVLPAIPGKHFETLSHTLVSALHAAGESYDAALLCNAANAPFIGILHLAGTPVALNVDGLERKRRKWGRLASAYYRLCETLAAVLPAAMVTDAEVIQRYYRRCYRAPSTMIAYGGDLEPPQGRECLDGLGLSPGRYALYVSRFEPENNPDRVVAAWARVPGNHRLVMLGSSRYAPELGRRVHELADDRVVLPGAVYGDGYRQLLFHCRLYIHATEVGGTHPALVEAMGAGRPVLYYDTPENREVVRDAGRPFRFSGARALEHELQGLLADDGRRAELGATARRRVEERYAWDSVTTAYEELLEGLC